MNNGAYTITDIPYERVDNLDEECQCVWCGKWHESGYNLDHFNYTICHNCIKKAAASWDNWQQDKTCDICRTQHVYCFVGIPNLPGNVWRICRNDLIKIGKYYARLNPTVTSFTNVADQYLAYLKQF